MVADQSPLQKGRTRLLDCRWSEMGFPFYRATHRVQSYQTPDQYLALQKSWHVWIGCGIDQNFNMIKNVFKAFGLRWQLYLLHPDDEPQLASVPLQSFSRITTGRNPRALQRHELEDIFERIIDVLSTMKSVNDPRPLFFYP